jgi:putative ABC transport system permease protein
MNRIGFYLRYAIRSLKRDSTRTLLAILCVAFGVLSLISMQLLSSTLLHGSLFDQRLSFGGDAIIQSAVAGEPLSAADLMQIEQWQQQGLIAAYSPISEGSGTFIRTENSARVFFLTAARGVDFSSYPLVGDFTLREPNGSRPSDVLRQPTDALVTRDTADLLGLNVGDTFMLSGGDTVPVRLTVAGIVGATPGQIGDSVYYSLETARLLENRTDVITEVAILWGTALNAQSTIVDSDYNVWVASTDRLESAGADVFDLMLKGAGVLGLLVGGVGVSNTLQVILARRKLEIAMLKTVGYQNAALLILIGLETGLIGIVGGVIGGAAGIIVTERLLDILNRSGSLMLDWSPDPIIVIGGVSAGAATALVFGLQTILATSATRPITLLRDLPPHIPPNVAVARLILYALLMTIFGLLVGVVFGSLVQGLGLVFAGILALAVLRVVFWGVLWVTLKLPVPPLPMLRLARRGLNRRKSQTSLAVLALFAGAFAVTFAAMVVYSGQATLIERRGTEDGYNLMIYTEASTVPEVVEAVRAQGAAQVYTSYPFNATLDGEWTTIHGRAADALGSDISLEAGAWAASPDSILLNSSYRERYNIGDKITLESAEQAQSLIVTGFYSFTAEADTNLAEAPGAAIVTPDLVISLGGARAQVVTQFPVNQLRSVADRLGAVLIDSLVFSKADLNDQLVATYQSLFTFAASMSGLAFVAGAILIANSTGLAVVERRREIGLFKAVGYTSHHVMRLLLSEYSFLGILSGVLGVLGAAMVIAVLRLAQPGMPIEFQPTIALAMIALTTVIAIISAALIIWRPAQVRPLDVLRYE